MIPRFKKWRLIRNHRKIILNSQTKIKNVYIYTTIETVWHACGIHDRMNLLERAAVV